MNISLNKLVYRFWFAPTVAAAFLICGTVPTATAALVATQQDQDVEQDENDDQDEDEDDDEDVVEGMALLGGAFGFGGEAVSKNYMQAVKKLDVLLQLEMQIDEMKTVCDLNEQSVKKLSVAAKAVAQKQVDKWTKSMDEFQMWGNMGMGAGVADEEEEELVDIDEIDLNEVDSNTLQWLSMDMTGMGNEGPTTEKIWKKAVKSALSDEQVKKLETVREERNKKLREATAQFYGQMYGSQLFLNDEKLEKFLDLMRKTLAKHDPPKSIDMSYNSLMHIGAISDDDFKDILSEAQLKRWKVLLGPYRNAAMWSMEVEDVVEEFDENSDAEEKAEASKGDGG